MARDGRILLAPPRVVCQFWIDLWGAACHRLYQAPSGARRYLRRGQAPPAVTSTPLKYWSRHGCCHSSVLVRRSTAANTSPCYSRAMRSARPDGRTTMKTALMAAVAMMISGLVSLAATDWKAPRMPWGEPDLEGTWTSQPELGVPFERPAEFSTRQRLTDEEFAQRNAQAQTQLKSDNADFDPETAEPLAGGASRISHVAATELARARQGLPAHFDRHRSTGGPGAGNLGRPAHAVCGPRAGARSTTDRSTARRTWASTSGASRAACRARSSRRSTTPIHASYKVRGSSPSRTR
jgi:hypothetical protein